jgi:hypothetical protein
VDVHRRARLACDGLGHEGGETVVAQRGFADQALEEEDVVGQAAPVAMGEFARSAQRRLPARCRRFQALRFGEIVDVVDDLAVFVDRRKE